MDNFLDQPKQFRGCHWRSKGSKIWLGIKNLEFDPNIHTLSRSSYVKCFNTKDNSIKIYESLGASSSATNINSATIRNYIQEEKIVNNLSWSYLPESESGDWIDDIYHDVFLHENSVGEQKEEDSIECKIEKNKTRKNFKCHGKVIL